MTDATASSLAKKTRISSIVGSNRESCEDECDNVL